jgi:hypothetical protein
LIQNAKKKKFCSQHLVTNFKTKILKAAAAHSHPPLPPAPDSLEANKKSFEKKL